MLSSTMRPTERFSARAESYSKYRPGYPEGVIDSLRAECCLAHESVIADVGSGTGLLSELFLKNGNRVFGVEPNREMRQKGEKLLAKYPGFVSVDGAAEATTLAEASVDFITSGQAFHWFEREEARAEFARILRLGGWVVLIWNERRTSSTPFLKAYEQFLLRYGTDYKGAEDLSGLVRPFFGPANFRMKTLENQQVFDLDGLKGRLLSTSYTPAPGDAGFEPMLNELSAIFEANQRGGKVVFEYDTLIYYGRLDPRTPSKRHERSPSDR
jgi:SAM-dependent methyltransferase